SHTTARIDAAQYFTDFMRSRVAIDPLLRFPVTVRDKLRRHRQVSRCRLRQHRANVIRQSSETSLLKRTLGVESFAICWHETASGVKPFSAGGRMQLTCGRVGPCRI